jgi:hypothetical protein
VTYPINAIASVFWIAIPPWIAIGGAFPFRFNATFAILGSLVLRVLEWAIVLKTKSEATKAGSHLHEYSIFRSQQMNEVTVPIKLRSVVLGFISGYKDTWLYHDNSFWTSFGVAEAVLWVQAWLMLCLLAMVSSFIGGTINIIIGCMRSEPNKIVASIFGMTLALVQVWMLWAPARFVLKNRTFKLSLRHTEVCVLLAIGIFVIVYAKGNIFEFKAFQKN